MSTKRRQTSDLDVIDTHRLPQDAYNVCMLLVNSQDQVNLFLWLLSIFVIYIVRNTKCFKTWHNFLTVC